MEWSMHIPGWSKCPKGSFMTGLKTAANVVSKTEVLTVGMTFGLSINNGKNCADEADKINCNRDWILGWEKFKVVAKQDATIMGGNEKVKLTGGRNGDVCRRYTDGRDYMRCTSQIIIPEACTVSQDSQSSRCAVESCGQNMCGTGTSSNRCSFTGTRRVRYGKSGSVTTRVCTNGCLCNNNVFGDPFPGTVKECHICDLPPETETSQWFEVKALGGTTVAFMADNGKWCSNKGSFIKCDANIIGPSETFRVNCVEGCTEDKKKKVGAGCTSIECLEKARCAKPCLEGNTTPLKYGHCYQANWWVSFNKEGWNKCREPYYLVGFYRNTCTSLYCIELGYCCTIQDSDWAQCDEDSWATQMTTFDNWATIRDNRFINGIYRKGVSSSIEDLTKVSYCNFKKR